VIGANPLDVAIIGAGPYGLSLAAHLQARGVDFRIFGKSMHTWRAHMPHGMFLKSEGGASNLYDPMALCSLRQYCAQEGTPYADYYRPVPLDVFTEYALSFQRRFVPGVEDVMVTALERRSAQFELRLASGEMVYARKVVIATGVSHAAHVPAEVATLPKELWSHSSAYRDLSRFKGRNVTVIGAGQSALESAALLHEAGADVLLLARRAKVVWNELPVPGRRSLYRRLRRPMSDLGPGLGPWLYSNAPQLFRWLPRGVRIARVKNTLGPAGGWWLKERVVDRVPMLLGYTLQGAETRGDGLLLHLEAADGERRQHTTGHVIAATGYRFSVRSQGFLSAELLAQLRTVNESPILSSHFESTVPGLYFTGLASAIQFGPVMRFLCGAGVTARRICRHIAGRSNVPGRRVSLPGRPSEALR
jgi:hypothetical protein